MLYKDLLSLIGETPLVLLEKFSSKVGNNNIYAKIESFNLTGSIKDRASKYMIMDAIESGRLKKGAFIIEATSGNTGISIASIAKSLGYESIIVMPESMSEERRKMIKNYGARLELTDASKGMAGAVSKAKEILEANPGSIIIDQFNNESNVRAHYETTGPEIYRDLSGKIDAVVIGVGTGGTISGIGKYLKEKNKDILVYAVEPSDSPLISKGVYGSHSIQGIGANFIPSIFDKNVVDEVITISDEEITAVKSELVETEGLLVGISSLAALAACKKVLTNGKNKNIVVIFPDGASKYFSTKFFK